MKNTIIEFENVSKTFKGKKVLDNVSFAINQGELHALIGRNGAGKSTIIKTIIFGNKIDSGTIKLNSIDYLDALAKQGIGYVPDHLELSQFLTVKKFLLRFYLLSGFGKKDSLAQITKMLNEFGLEGFENKRFRKLSMGQQKKVILIQSLINSPKLLILDEPTTNLDAFCEQELFSLLEKMNQQGTTILIVSHRLDLIQKYASNITVLKEGAVLKSVSTPKDLFKYLDKLLGGENE